MIISAFFRVFRLNFLILSRHFFIAELIWKPRNVWREMGGAAGWIQENTDSFIPTSNDNNRFPARSRFNARRAKLPISINLTPVFSPASVKKAKRRKFWNCAIISVDVVEWTHERFHRSIPPFRLKILSISFLFIFATIQFAFKFHKFFHPAQLKVCGN